MLLLKELNHLIFRRFLQRDDAKVGVLPSEMRTDDTGGLCRIPRSANIFQTRVCEAEGLP
jgi:hypothetical protein